MKMGYETSPSGGIPKSQISQFAPQLLQLGEQRTETHVGYLNKGEMKDKLFQMNHKLQSSHYQRLVQ